MLVLVDRFVFVLLIFSLFLFFIYIWEQTECCSSTTYAVMTQLPLYPEYVPHFEEIEKLIQQNSASNVTAELVPPYYRLENRYLVSPPYRLATCEIEKNMVTLRHSIFCYLTNTTQFIAQNRSISTEFWDNWLCDETFLRESISSVKDTIGPNLTLFAVIRHPVDRFLSGYVDKCLKDLTYYAEENRCFGCQKDVHCFVDALHNVFMEYYNNRSKNGRDPEAARMNDFYVRHFAPQTWYCELKEHRNEYIILNYHTGPNSTRSIAEDYYKLFERAGVPKKHLKTIYSEMMKGTTRHSTANSLERKVVEQQLLSDTYVMRRLMQMY
uniref:Carbohydrate sulfotransferase n=1 Tax=Haemonchus contortus TaxID=6289 RepID=A0A7I4Y7W8_HAECO